MSKFLQVSLIVLFTASYAVAEVSIYDIQFTDDPSGDSPWEGQTVATGGIVTAIDYTNQPIRYFIADREGGLWRGILVNDNAQRNLSVGDSVRFEAQVQESNSQTRLRNIVSGTFESLPAGVTIPATAILSGEIGEPAEGVLVELTSAIVTEIGDEIIVDDGSGTIVVGTGWSFAYEPLVGDTLQYLRGLVSSSGNDYEINPRSDEDFGFVSNRPPLISEAAHTPDLPTALDPVAVTARIFDDSGLQSANIFYRFGESDDFSSQPMFDDGQHGDSTAGDNLYGGMIPAGPERTTAEYYISATDSEGATGTSPATAPVEVYSYFIRSAHLTIFDLQYTGRETGGASPYDGELITVTGIVTGEEFGQGDFFMQDPGGGLWSGILVFNPPAMPARGDCVRVTARVQEYFDLTELSSVSDVTILGPGTLPDPIPIRAEELPDSAEAYEGVLISIGPTQITGIDDWLSFQQFDFRDFSGAGVALGDFGFEYEPFVGDSLTFMVGCGTYHSAVGYMIAPRDDNDLGIVDRRAPELVSAQSVSPYLINIHLNERISQTGIQDPANYQIIDVTDPGFPELHTESANLFANQRIIQIEVLESLIDTHAYSLTITQVEDLAGNVLENAQISFQGYDPTPTVAIADIYANFDSLNGMIATLRGVVNFMQDVTTTSGSRRISAYIQDESGFGFSLSQTGPAADFPNIRRGNLIEITGLINEFGGNIQLGSFNGNSEDIKLLSENVDLPEPIELRTGDLRTQHEIVQTSNPQLWGSGTWCKTTGTAYQVDENVGGGTNIFIDDGSGNLTVRIWDSMNLDSVFLDNEWLLLGELIGRRMSVSGPASTFDGDFQMLAGYAEDFTDVAADFPVDPPSEGLVLDVPNRPFAPDLGQSITISYNAPSGGSVRLRLYNLRGQLVHTLVDKTAGGPDVIVWDGRDKLRNILPMGTYILHLESVRGGNSDTKIKPIVIGTKL